MRESCMLTLLITFAVSNCIKLKTADNYEKCCATDEHLKRVNNTFNCVKNNEKRLNVVLKENDFLTKNQDGVCQDSYENNYYTFKVKNGSVTQNNIIEDEYFPKCCPPNYYYDSLERSCVETVGDTLKNFIKHKYVNVGLPNCKVIVDEKVNDSIGTKRPLSDKKQNAGSFCMDRDTNHNFVKRKCLDNLDICSGTRCIKKCCPDGQSFVNGGHCVDTHVNGINLNFSENIRNPSDDYVVLYNTKCTQVYIMDENRYIFELLSDGVFKIWMNKTQQYENLSIDNDESYCIEHAQSGKVGGWHFFFCYLQKPTEAKFVYTWWAKILSCIFVLITILVYLILNETRNTFGRVLINYCIADFAEMALLAYAQVHGSGDLCRFRGYLTIFFALAIFTWLNTLCLVVWRTFRSTTVMTTNKLSKFLYYFIYGWGVPLLITLFILLFETYEVLPVAVQPYVGYGKCFIDKRKNNYASLVFLQIPQLILQIINTFLFFKTILHFLKIKKKIDRLEDSTKINKRKKMESDKERLFLIIKLSVIMGVFFIFEVVSSFFVMSKISPFAKYLEIFMDNIICLQGVFIFIIFICKRKVFESLKKQFCGDNSELLKHKISVTDTKVF